MSSARMTTTFGRLACGGLACGSGRDANRSNTYARPADRSALCSPRPCSRFHATISGSAIRSNQRSTNGSSAVRIQRSSSAQSAALTDACPGSAIRLRSCSGRVSSHSAYSDLSNPNGRASGGASGSWSGAAPRCHLPKKGRAIAGVLERPGEGAARPPIRRQVDAIGQPHVVRDQPLLVRPSSGQQQCAIRRAERKIDVVAIEGEPLPASCSRLGVRTWGVAVNDMAPHRCVSLTTSTTCGARLAASCAGGGAATPHALRSRSPPVSQRRCAIVYPRPVGHASPSHDP